MSGLSIAPATLITSRASLIIERGSFSMQTKNRIFTGAEYLHRLAQT